MHNAFNKLKITLKCLGQVYKSHIHFINVHNLPTSLTCFHLFIALGDKRTIYTLSFIKAVLKGKQLITLCLKALF